MMFLKTLEVLSWMASLYRGEALTLTNVETGHQLKVIPMGDLITVREFGPGGVTVFVENISRKEMSRVLELMAKFAKQEEDSE